MLDFNDGGYNIARLVLEAGLGGAEDITDMDFMYRFLLATLGSSCLFFCAAVVLFFLTGPR
jgi:hypothetical protein